MNLLALLVFLILFIILNNYYMDNDSFTIGWLECRFLMNRMLFESEAKRYVELAKKLNHKNEEIENYIKKTYPNIVF